jgi:hypothetical protein
MAQQRTLLRKIKGFWQIGANGKDRRINRFIVASYSSPSVDLTSIGFQGSTTSDSTAYVKLDRESAVRLAAEILRHHPELSALTVAQLVNDVSE